MAKNFPKTTNQRDTGSVMSNSIVPDLFSSDQTLIVIAGIKNIIGPGIKNQKKWLTCCNFLSLNEYKTLNYSEQSEMILNLNGIDVLDKIPRINIHEDSLKNIEPKIILNNKNFVSFGFV